MPLTNFKLKTNENVRYIIGSLAIIAILFMNFRYAYHNYGIPKHRHEACATTKPLGYNHVKVATHMMCTFIEYRVEVHYKTHTYDINSVTHRKEPCKHEVIDYEYFRDFDRKKAFNAATNFAANIYKPDSAKVESFYTYVHAPYESYRIECSYGGDLIDCTSEDATCPTCNSNN